MIRWIVNAVTQRDDLLRIATDYRDVCFEQRELLMRKDEEIMRLKLEYTRWGRDVIERFIILLDNPEIDARDLLWEAVRDMNDEVARLEEHATA